ncbi:Syntaxin-binding protein 5 [Varanus komodoensis]|nr:Syntaxin-binding protein 5 [Varanus komodoensis]
MSSDFLLVHIWYMKPLSGVIERYGLKCHQYADDTQLYLSFSSNPVVIADLCFGRPGVECYCQHDSGAAVIQLQFLINEGALVSALADDTLHLWNLRQKRPAILHSLKFNRERAGRSSEAAQILIPSQNHEYQDVRATNKGSNKIRLNSSDDDRPVVVGENAY